MLKNNLGSKDIIINNTPSEKDKFVWNMVGSGVFSASAMLMSLIVIKVSGAGVGGDFAISLTIGQIVLCIAYFEMRTFQVTDVENQFQFEDYHTSKVIVCLISLVVALLYIWTKEYDSEKSLIILLVCFARFLDGYADVFEAQFHKEGRLDIAGKSLLYRTIGYVGVLSILLLITKKIVISLVFADAMAFYMLWRYDICIMRCFRGTGYSRQWLKILQLLKQCCPLFIGSFCWTYILSASRLAIDLNMTSQYQAYFQVIFMPVSVISLFASFIFRPMLPKLSKAYFDGTKKEFYGALKKGILSVCGVTSVCMMLAYFCGIQVLSFVSGCELTVYRGILVFLIFSGGFNAMSFIMYYALTIMRCYRGILSGYVISAVLGLLISSPMVKKAGILGASWSYFISVVVLCVLFGIFISLNIYWDSQMKHEENFKKDENA